MARIQLVTRHEPTTDKVEVLYAGVSPDAADAAFKAAKAGPHVADVAWFDNAIPRRRFRHDAVPVAAKPAKGKAAKPEAEAPVEAPAPAAEADPLA